MNVSLKNRFLLAIGALALGAVVAGCSSAADMPTGFPQDNPGGGSGSTDGGSMQQPNGGSGASSGASGSSGGTASTGANGASSGSGSGSGGSSGGSGSGSGGGSGSGSGSSSGGGNGRGPDAGAASADASGGGLDATSGLDAASPRESGTNSDMGAPPGSDAGGLCADQAVWLDPMNAARAAVNAGEPPLVCDPIAMQVALNYANKCMYAHNANRSADYNALGGRGGLGEDIAAGAPTESISGAITSWTNESVDYDHATNTCAAGKVCGHYTQIVWKATTGVGCAHVSCTTNSPFGTFSGGKWDFSVCDFSPPGNFVGQPPY